MVAQSHSHSSCYSFAGQELGSYRLNPGCWLGGESVSCPMQPLERGPLPSLALHPSSFTQTLSSPGTSECGLLENMVFVNVISYEEVILGEGGRCLVPS